MAKLFILCLLSGLFFLISDVASVSAEPYVKKKAKEEAGEKSEGPDGGKAKPSAARNTPPELRSQPQEAVSPPTSLYKLYKWKDESGKWRISDTPPTGVKAQQVGGAEK